MTTRTNMREGFEIRGDDSPNMSSMTGMNAVDGALCHPRILWRDKILTVDVFQAGEEQPRILVYCPLCTARDPNNERNMSLTIRGEAKELHVDHKAFPRLPGYSIEDIMRICGLSNRDEVRGVISVEKFRCPWEEKAENDRGATGVVGGLISAVCDWEVVIDNNVARDV